jgi:hypothetical protein
MKVSYVNLPSKSFFRRPEGVGFWVMMLLSVPFAGFTSAGTEMRDWLFAVVFFTAGWIVFLGSWLVFARHRPLSVPMEKVERACFWTMVPAAIMFLLPSSVILCFTFSPQARYHTASFTHATCLLNDSV